MASEKVDGVLFLTLSNRKQIYELKKFLQEASIYQMLMLKDGN